MSTSTAFCTSCSKTVYIADGDTAVCPVCSSPLLPTQEEEPIPQEESETAV